MEAFKVIFWDFDGVIMNSMPIRDKGFIHLFKNYPDEQVKQLLDFHHQNGGLSRYVKIRYFYEQILGKSITDEEVQKLANEFSTIMRQELINPDLLIPETMEFIKRNYKQKRFHIVSGSDQNELRYLCEQLGINPYFISVHGSPTPKKLLLKELLQSHQYAPSECLMIGDAINDFDAANENLIPFAGYNNTKLKDVGVFYIYSFLSL